jgi:hypothetical protein
MATWCGPHLQSVFDQWELVKHLSQDFVRKVPLKLGIMSTISSNEIVDLIGNIRTGYPGIEVRAPRKNPRVCASLSRGNKFLGWVHLPNFSHCRHFLVQLQSAPETVEACAGRKRLPTT